MKEEKIKKQTITKIKWAVKAYREWCQLRMINLQSFHAPVYEADLDRVGLLEKDGFQYSMCKFLTEVTELSGDDYPGKTLYHMVVSIQKHLVQNRKKWCLIESTYFNDLHNVLNNIGIVKEQAGMISLDIESQLWESGVLWEETPDQLRSTVLFILGLNLGLCAGDEHYALHRDTKDNASQLSFKKNYKGANCLVYQEDNVTKTNDGGFKHIKLFGCIHLKTFKGAPSA